MSFYNRHKLGGFSRESSKSLTVAHDEGDKSSSLPDKFSYVMEHLATFTVNKDAGIIHPMDGMRRLFQMEKNTGIWSQKMRLCLDSGCVLITDFETGDLIESFPAYLVQHPTAFTSDDVLELYNNVLVFIVSAGCSVQSEMHIFQSQSISAVSLVQDIKSLQNNDILLHSKPATLSSADNSDGHFTLKKNIDREFQKNNSRGHGVQENPGKVNARYDVQMDYEDNEKYIPEDCGTGLEDVPENEFGGIIGRRIFEDACSVSSEKYEREVNLLNSCFDDIEKFIARLQHTAAAVREVEKRRHKKREIGDGLMNLHTRPPIEKEFIEILAKFKLSFNLLSKLKTHIHDPNAPELVHFLFTPLALIVEAARDTYTESQLAANVIDPLLTRDTINFLINCVSSKETELWRSLGVSWTIPEDQWHEKKDVFHTGLVDESNQENLILNNFDAALTISRPEQHTLNAISRHVDCKKDLPKRSFSRPSSKYTHVSTEPPEVEQFDSDLASQNIPGMENDESRGIQGTKKEKIGDKVNPSFLQNISGSKTGYMLLGIDTFEDQWLNELRIKGANIVVVCYPRMANNDKELSVTKGEYLEILDDSRKWWKARNQHGQVAHVPSTIVTQVGNSSDKFSDRKILDATTQNKS